MNLNGKVFNPGEMRTWITLERRAIVEDDGGYQGESWNTIAGVWSRWENVHGTEAWTASALQAEQPATVMIRYRAGLDATCVVKKGGVRFEVVSLDDIQERHEYIELKIKRMRSG